MHLMQGGRRKTRPVGVALVAAAWIVAAVACGARPLPEPDNELPFGFMDVPANGATVGRVTRVAGWALDDGRVTRVDVYVDGHFRGSATPAAPRPDVAKAFPAYARQADTCGWEVNVDLGDRSVPVTILAQAIDDRGATRDLGTVTVSIVGR
jgi:hypothetical protein